MSKPSYYDLRRKGTADIHEKFMNDLDEGNKIDPKLYIHIIGMRYGLSKKFVLDTLSNMAELHGFKEQDGLYIRGDD